MPSLPLPRVRQLLGLVLAVAGLVPVLTAAPASAATVSVRLSSYDATLLHDINAARKAHGRKPLVLAAGTTDVAHRWSCSMRHDALLSHRPNLIAALEYRGSSNWHTLGENVGMSGSGDAGALFHAYMASPEHRANILDSGYQYIGIHTSVSRTGIRWNTLDFVDAYSTSYGATRSTC